MTALMAEHNISQFSNSVIKIKMVMAGIKLMSSWNFGKYNLAEMLFNFKKDSFTTIWEHLTQTRFKSKTDYSKAVLVARRRQDPG